MTETIGKVTLDLTHYTGEDLYCDGEVEDRILELVQKYPGEEYDELIRETKEWPVLYHLSSIRGNIVRWIPFTGNEKVLEIGAGEGAVTGALSERCKQVDCVELSKKRSQINAFRHKEAENITIHVGNFEDIEPSLDRDYDYIFLIGVLEYARSYLHTADPFREELRRVLTHVRRGGRVVIAIENRLGLKYFAGCAEDHSGRYFDGVESYPEADSPACTFSRPVLERMLQDVGALEYSFYYPYPDYKFVSALYSDRRLPEASELNENIRNFDRDRLLLFDEQRAYRGIVQDGLYPIFANSFEIVVGPALPVCYCKFSNDRQACYRIMTRIDIPVYGTAAGAGMEGPRVVKYPLTKQAASHVAHMEESAKALALRYDNASTAPGETPLHIAPCERTADGGVVFPFIQGRSLESLLDDSLAKGDGNTFLALLESYRLKVGAGSACPVADYDMTFSNILISGNEWTALDYEWAVDRSIPESELLFRSLLVYYLEDEKRSLACEELIGQQELLKRLGIPQAKANALAQEERDFQLHVTGGLLSLGELRSDLGTQVLKPAELQTREEKEAIEEERKRSREEKNKEEQALTCVQVYFDTGKGYREEESYWVGERYREEGCIDFVVMVFKETRNLRVDPSICPCIVMLREVKVNGVSILKKARNLVRTNGRKYTNGSIIYTTSDPGMEWSTRDLCKAAGITGEKEFSMELVIQLAGLPSTMAQAMQGDYRPDMKMRKW